MQGKKGEGYTQNVVRMQLKVYAVICNFVSHVILLVFRIFIRGGYKLKALGRGC